MYINITKNLNNNNDNNNIKYLVVIKNNNPNWEKCFVSLTLTHFQLDHIFREISSLPFIFREFTFKEFIFREFTDFKALLFWFGDLINADLMVLSLHYFFILSPRYCVDRTVYTVQGTENSTVQHASYIIPTLRTLYYIDEELTWAVWKLVLPTAVRTLENISSEKWLLQIQVYKYIFICNIP